MTERQTLVEMYLTNDQLTILTLVVQDNGDPVRDLLAEGLYRAGFYWDRPGVAAGIVINEMFLVYKTCEIFVGRNRRQPDSEVIVVDFISRLISDRVESQSYKFQTWVERRGVLEE